jgi:hypothetical protein
MEGNRTTDEIVDDINRRFESLEKRLTDLEGQPLNQWMPYEPATKNKPLIEPVYQDLGGKLSDKATDESDSNKPAFPFA